MPRVKRGKVRTQKRRALLSKTKGYKWGRKNLTRMAKTAVNKAGAYALRDRRAKKREMRRLWQIQLNAAVRKFELSYSKFIGLLKSKNIELDRKVLADMAGNNPELFEKIVEKVKS
jgi:large subunit ribosomal protein L20